MKRRSNQKNYKHAYITHNRNHHDDGGKHQLERRLHEPQYESKIVLIYGIKKKAISIFLSHCNFNNGLRQEDYVISTMHVDNLVSMVSSVYFVVISTIKLLIITHRRGNDRLWWWTIWSAKTMTPHEQMVRASEVQSDHAWIRELYYILG